MAGGAAEEASSKRSPREHGMPRLGIVCLAWRRAVRDAFRMVDFFMDMGGGVFHVGMKILGPFLVCVAVSLISFATYTFFAHALPHMEQEIGTAGQGGLSVLGLFLVSNTLYNYGKAICSDAGTPPGYKEAMETIALKKDVEADEVGEPRKKRQCKRCDRYKPPRTHHCSVCRRCVLKMDHHCPWINNCVGFGNYRHFCLFLLFLAMSCIFVIVVFLATFSEFILDVRIRRKKFPDRFSRQCIMTSFMICCSILVALALLGGFHFYLVLTNQTTIEFQSNWMRSKEARKNGEYFRNEYDLGRTRNFQAVFGPNPVCRFRWLLPCVALRPTGDGMDFPSISRIRI